MGLITPFQLEPTTNRQREEAYKATVVLNLRAGIVTDKGHKPDLIVQMPYRMPANQAGSDTSSIGLSTLVS